MKIAIRDIPAQGLEIRESIDPAVLDLCDEDLKCVSPVEVQAFVERVSNDTVIADTHIRTNFSFSCGRCLVPFTREIAVDILLSFDVDKRKEFIDLADDVRQEVILALPAAVFCREDCRGLCPGCGANLNTEKCNCKRD